MTARSITLFQGRDLLSPMQIFVELINQIVFPTEPKLSLSLPMQTYLDQIDSGPTNDTTLMVSTTMPTMFPVSYYKNGKNPIWPSILDLSLDQPTESTEIELLEFELIPISQG